MKAYFWERTDVGVKKIATLFWDGITIYWFGSKIDMVKKILEGPFNILDGRSFDPSKDWTRLEELISGSRLWVTIQEIY